MRLPFAGLSLALLAAAAEAPPPVDRILQKIAESQEQAQAAREKIVYTQFVHAKLLRANGKLAREEKRTYTVTPKAKGFERKLEKFEGWYESKGQMLFYGEPGFEYKGIDIDGNLMDGLIDDWTGSSDSRDGVDRDLFPLTAEHQPKYDFRFAGEAKSGARDVYRLTYSPREKKSAAWKGDVLVDPETLYPVNMNSTFAYRVPRAVKIIFGISLRQLGFSVNYEKAIDELWFPSTAGTEFHFRVLFGYARTLTLSMKNSDFRHASAESTVTFAPVQEETK